MREQGTLSTSPVGWTTLASLLGYTLITLALFRNQLALLDRFIVANPFDGLDNWWNVWWVRRALFELHANPYQTPLLWYDLGAPLYLHSLSPINGILSVALAPWLGDVISYNVLVLATFPLGGYCCYLLLSLWVHHPGIRFLGGLIYMLSPYHFGHLAGGHLNFCTFQFVPLFLFWWYRGVQRPNLVRGLLAGLGLALVALSDLHYLIFSLLIVLTTWLVGLVRRPKTQAGPGRFGFAIGIVVVLLICLAPLMGLVVDELLRHPYTPGHDPAVFAADLLMYAVPGETSYWGSWTERIWSQFSGKTEEQGGYVGLVTTLGVVLALCYRVSAAYRWVLVAGIFFALSLGPQLRVGGQDTGLSMPFAWLDNALPVFTIMGTPIRYCFGVMIALTVAAALAFDKVVTPLSARSRWLFALILSGVAVAEFLPGRISVTEVTLSKPELEALEQIRESPGSFAVLTAPTHNSYWHKYYQTYHQQPLIGGFTSRVRYKRWNDLLHEPLVPVLYGIRDPYAMIDLPVLEHKPVIRKLGIRYVISMRPKYDKLCRDLRLQQVFQSDRFRIFKAE